MVPNMPFSMVTIPMVVNSMSSLAKKDKFNLGNMHNKNIQGNYYTHHLFCLFVNQQRAAIFQNVQFSIILKKIG